MNIIPETDSANEQKADNKRQILLHRTPVAKHHLPRHPHQDGDGEDDATAAKHDCRVRTPLVGFVDDVALIRNAEI